MDSKKVHILPTSKIPDAVCSFVAEASREAIANRGAFYIGVSGGSVANFLGDGLPHLTDIHWEKWHIFFCDERHVPFDHADSTYRIYKEKLVGKTNLQESQLYGIKPDMSVEDAAKDYAEVVKKVPASSGGCLPVFDLLVLGMGPDGHTCSLFPGHMLLNETSLIVAPISDSPKPPPCRVTLTYPVINAARSAMFASAGAGKAVILQRVLEGKDDPPLPAARVKLSEGTVHWFIDESAASELKSSY
ncbi:6-phosphogluconolactonase-like [Diadema antillarum]|uniref:6-phosphogluconolactonase-like n=1 Tax=Diadema antillarum TaxID=105358 RepID=UPI003A8C5D19